MKQLNFAKGLSGEKIASIYLTAHKFRILAKRFKTQIGEIDIIMTDEVHLIFVEVKARSSLRFGEPSEAVGIDKQRKISQVACQYIKRHRLSGVPVRFDIVEVDLEKSMVSRHIEGAFDSFVRY